MADLLYFQGTKEAVLHAGAGYPAEIFTGKILWVDPNDAIKAARLIAAGYELIAEVDPRYAQAVKKGNLHDFSLKEIGL